MPRRPLTPDVQLSVLLSAICSRNRFTSDPGPVIEQLLTTAGDKTELLAAEVGHWAGFYDDAYTHELCAAIVDQVPGAAEWVRVGKERRDAPVHGTRGYKRPLNAEKCPLPPRRWKGAASLRFS